MKRQDFEDHDYIDLPWRVSDVLILGALFGVTLSMCPG